MMLVTSFRICVNIAWLPCIFTPFQLEKLAMTVSAPASIAAG